MLSPPTAKVGKTSLIMSLVGEEFPEEVSARATIGACRLPLIACGDRCLLIVATGVIGSTALSHGQISWAQQLQ